MASDYAKELDILIRDKQVIPVKNGVKYKVLDKNDEDSQGLFKNAAMIRLGTKGLTMNTKHFINAEDVVLVEFDLGEYGYVKGCCEVIDCAKKEKEDIYDIHLSFIILKHAYKENIEMYINNNENNRL
ncbi:MAG: hypothetical protein ACLFP1_04690 [Candidatus Goldiibacteriota bacterium]